MIVGGLASLSHGVRRASPLWEGAKKCALQKRRKIYESNRNCQKSGRFGQNRHPKRNQKNFKNPGRGPLADNIDTNRQVLYCDT